MTSTKRLKYTQQTTTINTWERPARAALPCGPRQSPSRLGSHRGLAAAATCPELGHDPGPVPAGAPGRSLPPSPPPPQRCPARRAPPAGSGRAAPRPGCGGSGGAGVSHPRPLPGATGDTGAAPTARHPARTDTGAGTPARAAAAGARGSWHGGICRVRLRGSRFAVPPFV